MQPVDNPDHARSPHTYGLVGEVSQILQSPLLESGAFFLLTVVRTICCQSYVKFNRAPHEYTWEIEKRFTRESMLTDCQIPLMEMNLTTTAMDSRSSHFAIGKNEMSQQCGVLFKEPKGTKDSFLPFPNQAKVCRTACKKNAIMVKAKHPGWHKVSPVISTTVIALCWSTRVSPSPIPLLWNPRTIISRTTFGTKTMTGKIKCGEAFFDAFATLKTSAVFQRK